MKRSPITRKTPLKSNHPLRQKTPLRSKKPINKRSEKTRGRYVEERVPFVERMLEERPWCEACKVFAQLDGLTFYRVRPSVDVHEVASRGRTGGVHSSEWLDERNVLCLCRNHHTRITENVIEAQLLGFQAIGIDFETAAQIRELRASGKHCEATRIWSDRTSREFEIPDAIKNMCKQHLTS